MNARNAGYGRILAAELRMKALQIVAGSDNPVCENCGCNYAPFLEINHKGGGGPQEYGYPGRAQQAYARKYGKGGSTGFYTKIASGGRSVEDLNVLCRVCNAVDYLTRKNQDEASRFSIIWSPVFVKVSSLRKPCSSAAGMVA